MATLENFRRILPKDDLVKIKVGRECINLYIPKKGRIVTLDDHTQVLFHVSVNSYGVAAEITLFYSEILGQVILKRDIVYDRKSRNNTTKTILISDFNSDTELIKASLVKSGKNLLREHLLTLPEIITKNVDIEKYITYIFPRQLREELKVRTERLDIDPKSIYEQKWFWDLIEDTNDVSFEMYPIMNITHTPQYKGNALELIGDTLYRVRVTYYIRPSVSKIHNNTEAKLIQDGEFYRMRTYRDLGKFHDVDHYVDRDLLKYENIISDNIHPDILKNIGQEVTVIMNYTDQPKWHKLITAAIIDKIKAMIILHDMSKIILRDTPKERTKITIENNRLQGLSVTFKDMDTSVRNTIILGKYDLGNNLTKNTIKYIINGSYSRYFLDRGLFLDHVCSDEFRINDLYIKQRRNVINIGIDYLTTLTDDSGVPCQVINIPNLVNDLFKDRNSTYIENTYSSGNEREIDNINKIQEKVKTMSRHLRSTINSIYGKVSINIEKYIMFDESQRCYDIKIERGRLVISLEDSILCTNRDLTNNDNILCDLVYSGEDDMIKYTYHNHEKKMVRDILSGDLIILEDVFKYYSQLEYILELISLLKNTIIFGKNKDKEQVSQDITYISELLTNAIQNTKTHEKKFLK